MFISPYDTLFIPVKISLSSHQVFSRYQHCVLPLRSVIVPLRKAYFAGSNRIRGGYEKQVTPRSIPAPLPPNLCQVACYPGYCVEQHGAILCFCPWGASKFPFNFPARSLRSFPYLFPPTIPRVLPHVFHRSSLCIPRALRHSFPRVSCSRVTHPQRLATVGAWARSCVKLNILRFLKEGWITIHQINHYPVDKFPHICIAHPFCA